MKRSLGWSAALLGIVLLLSAVSASAKTMETSVQAQVGPAASIYSAVLAVPSEVVTISASALSTWGDDGDKDKDGDGDNDKDDHHHKHHHEPTPEPSTLLSFGAAILIGGGVLYSRRVRKSK